MKIVLDLLIKFEENIFTYEGTKKYIGVTWIPLLHQKAKEDGTEVMLAEKYIKEQKFSAQDVFISEGITPYTKKLFFAGAKPLILFSGESPNVDWKLYSFLKKYSKLYRYTMLFDGFRRYVHLKTNFLPFYWPNDNCLINNGAPLHISKRPKKLVMIAGNKKQNSTESNGFLKRGLKTTAMKVITSIVPSMQLKDLYSSRMEAILFFSGRDYFDLYGRNWNDHSNLSREEREAVMKLNPKEVVNKYQLLSQYKFALCFENCVYPGYITEKIFDCFIAGSVPIYWGAPDIENYMPADLFIDMRQFKNFLELENHINSLTEDQVSEYRNRIDIYLKSAEVKRFTDVQFSNTIMSLAKDETTSSQY